MSEQPAQTKILKISVPGEQSYYTEIRCKFCDIFYVKNADFYGPSKDPKQRINQVRFMCPYCEDKGIQTYKFRLITADKISCLNVWELFTEEMPAHQNMKTAIVQIIQEVSKALGSDAKSPRHFINYLYSQKHPFDKDFIYSVKLQRPPDPIAHLNSAISYFEGIEMGHCPEDEKRDWILKALSHLTDLQKELKFTHRNLY